MEEKTEEKILNTPLFKVVLFFLKNPYKEVYLRGVARDLKISPYSSKKFLDFLKEEDLIREEKKANLRYFRANTSNLLFKHLKITFNIKRILDSGLLDYIKDNVSALSSIILFGSFARGEDSEDSDIDMVVIGKNKKINISKYKQKLKRDITLFIFSQSEWKKKYREDRAFYQDVIAHGTALYGNLPIL